MKNLIITKDKKGNKEQKNIDTSKIKFYIEQINAINEFTYICFLSTNYKPMETDFNKFVKNPTKDILTISSTIFNTINCFYTSIELWKKYFSKYKNNTNIFPTPTGKSFFEIKDSELFDKHFQYSVVKILRNYAQHRALPFTDLEISKNLKRVLISIRALLCDKRIKGESRKILEKHKHEIFIDLFPAISKAFEYLDELNDYAFKLASRELNIKLILACENISNLVDVNKKYACLAWVNEDLPDNDYYKVEHIEIPIRVIKFLKENKLI